MPDCVYCGEVATTTDHLVPQVRKGSHRDDNLVPACLQCNQAKADREPVKWITKSLTRSKSFITRAGHADPGIRMRVAESIARKLYEYQHHVRHLNRSL